MEKNPDKLSHRTIAVSIAVLGIIASITSFFFQYADNYNSRAEEYYLQTRELRSAIDERDKRIKTLELLTSNLKNELALLKDVAENNASPEDRAAVELRASVASLNADMLALKQAIDPTFPEEILTIVRLKDKIEKVNEEQAERSANFQRQFDEFKREVRADAALNNGMILTIFTIVMTAVLGLLIKLLFEGRKRTTPNGDNGE